MKTQGTVGLVKHASLQQALQKLAARKSWRQLMEVVPDSELLGRARQQAQQAGRPVPNYVGDSANYFMVQKADPSRNLPERVLGGISARGQPIPHVSKSFMDRQVQGTGLATKMYKDVARKMNPNTPEAGLLSADGTQTPDSTYMWESMARSSVRDALKSARNRPVVVPQTTELYSGGPYMHPGQPVSGPPVEGNFMLRMPPGSVPGPPGRVAPSLDSLWPTTATSPSPYSPTPFSPTSSLEIWAEGARNVRRALGQPDFPAPNPRSTFAEFARRNLPTRRVYEDSVVNPLANQRDLLREGMRARFAQSGKTYDEGVKELQQKLRDRQPSQERPQVLRPVFGDPGSDRPTGYAVRPLDQIRQDPGDLAGRRTK